MEIGTYLGIYYPKEDKKYLRLECITTKYPAHNKYLVVLDFDKLFGTVYYRNAIGRVGHMDIREIEKHYETRGNYE